MLSLAACRTAVVENVPHFLIEVAPATRTTTLVLHENLQARDRTALGRRPTARSRRPHGSPDAPPAPTARYRSIVPREHAAGGLTSRGLRPETRAQSRRLVPRWYLGARSNLLQIAANRSFAGTSTRVSEGTRTPDRLDHNQELYQLSYAHRAALNLAALAGAEGAQQPPAIIRP
ncbi:MAG: hypothetical protein QOD83_3688 [Solirubrobacteraceae bacterium]|nr:hypothetical protein [Solirubrobacteraceae bacterium]